MKRRRPQTKPRVTVDKAVQTMDKHLTIDAFANTLARLGFGAPNLMEATEYPIQRLTRNYQLMNSLYRNSWIIGKIIDTKSGDMTKNWYKLSCQVTPEQIDAFEKMERKTRVKAKILEGLKWGDLYGGAAALMLIEGHEDMLDQPLVYDHVMPGSFKGLLVMDRWSGISPGVGLVKDVNDPEFGLPDKYMITPDDGNAFEVHHSRILRFTGRPLPYWERISEMYWGASEVERIYEELKKRDNTSGNIAQLIFLANLRVLRMSDLGTMLAASTPETQRTVYNTIQAQSWLMSNTGMYVMDKEDEFDTKQYTFSGVNDIYESFMLDVAGASDIPVTKLFGRAPAGMNATGESDLQNYWDMIGQRQEEKLSPVLDKLLPVMAMSTWGAVPDDLDYEYNPVQEMSDDEKAELTGKTVEAIDKVYNSGIISQRTALKELSQLKDTTGAFSNITDQDIAQADDKPVQPDMMGGDPNGLPGQEQPQDDSAARIQRLEGNLEYLGKVTKKRGLLDKLFKHIEPETEDGGPGSGHFGHKGRPGMRGGSGKGGTLSSGEHMERRGVAISKGIETHKAAGNEEGRKKLVQRLDAIMGKLSGSSYNVQTKQRQEPGSPAKHPAFNMTKPDLEKRLKELEEKENAQYWKFSRTSSSKVAPPSNGSEILAIQEALGKAKSPWQTPYEEFNARKPIPRESHKKNVEAALAAGKPVPESVLKDYPELTQGTQAPEQKAAGPKEQGQVIGTGNTGDVVKIGDKVYKNAVNKNGKPTEEGAVYAALQGVEGIAPGKEVNLNGEKKIETPYYSHFISSDTFPKAQRSKATRTIQNNMTRINGAVAALSSKGYMYSDPLQFGYNDGKLDLMDFSNAHKPQFTEGAAAQDPVTENYQHLARFYDDFGLGGQAQVVREGVLTLRDSLKDNDPDMWEYLAPEHQAALKQLRQQDPNMKPNNVYYATNQRMVQQPGIMQTDPIDGVKYIFSEKPLTDQQMADWEIKPILHNPEAGPKESWQMTRQEHLEGRKTAYENTRRNYKPPVSSITRTGAKNAKMPPWDYLQEMHANQSHKLGVIEALKAGRQVPESVLNDYPDLKQKASHTDSAPASALERLDGHLATLSQRKTTDGGSGSGNFGHKGRPGQVGGSGKGGGNMTEGETPEGVGVEKLEKSTGSGLSDLEKRAFEGLPGKEKVGTKSDHPDVEGEEIKTEFDTPKVLKARKAMKSIESTHKINTPERLALRREMRDKLYEYGGEVPKGDEKPRLAVPGGGARLKERKAWFIMGPPASGKSTIADPLLEKHGAMLIDSDEAKKMIPEFDNGRGAGTVHEESSWVNSKLFKKAAANGDNMVFPLIGKKPEKVSKLLQLLKKRGYEVHLQMLEIDPHVAARRALVRFEKTNRFVDPHYVLNEVGLKPSKSYDILRSEGGFASYEKWSNDVPHGQKPKLLDSYRPGEGEPRSG